MSGIGPYKQPVDSSVTVDGTSKEILPSNTGRVSASIENLGSTRVFIAFGADAVLGQGRSIPSGATKEIEIQNELDMWAQNFISGITDGTSVDLSVSEVNR